MSVAVLVPELFIGSVAGFICVVLLVFLCNCEAYWSEYVCLCRRPAYLFMFYLTFYIPLICIVVINFTLAMINDNTVFNLDVVLWIVCYFFVSLYQYRRFTILHILTARRFHRRRRYKDAVLSTRDWGYIVLVAVICILWFFLLLFKAVVSVFVMLSILIACFVFTNDVFLVCWTWRRIRIAQEIRDFHSDHGENSLSSSAVLFEMRRMSADARQPRWKNARQMSDKHKELLVYGWLRENMNMNMHMHMNNNNNNSINSHLTTHMRNAVDYIRIPSVLKSMIAKQFLFIPELIQEKMVRAKQKQERRSQMHRLRIRTIVLLFIGKSCLLLSSVCVWFKVGISGHALDEYDKGSAQKEAQPQRALNILLSLCLTAVAICMHLHGQKEFQKIRECYGNALACCCYCCDREYDEQTAKRNAYYQGMTAAQIVIITNDMNI